MTTTVVRDLDQPTRPARPAPVGLHRHVSAHETGRHFTPGRARTVAVEATGQASPIRVWRAAETHSGRTPEHESGATGAASGAGPSFGRGAGARLDATERAARRRVIEQAWKAERARQAELEAEEAPDR